MKELETVGDVMNVLRENAKSSKRKYAPMNAAERAKAEKVFMPGTKETDRLDESKHITDAITVNLNNNPYMTNKILTKLALFRDSILRRQMQHVDPSRGIIIEGINDKQQPKARCADLFPQGFEEEANIWQSILNAIGTSAAYRRYRSLSMDINDVVHTHCIDACFAGRVMLHPSFKRHTKLEDICLLYQRSEDAVYLRGDGDGEDCLDGEDIDDHDPKTKWTELHYWIGSDAASPEEGLATILREMKYNFGHDWTDYDYLKYYQEMDDLREIAKDEREDWFKLKGLEETY